jgi:hypothetical protein
MTRCRGIGPAIEQRGFRGLALAGMLTICGVLTGAQAHAFEPPPGSKNFTAPSSVPSYFSNEAAPLGRGPQTVQPGADRFNTAPSAASYGHAAVSVSQPLYSTTASVGRGMSRSKLARGGSGRSRFGATRQGRAYSGRTHGRIVLSRSPAMSTSRKSTAPSYAGRSRHASSSTRYAHRTSR